MHAIAGKTKLLGVVGYPVEHSLSPTMHNAAIAQMGLDYVYLPFPVNPDDLANAVDGFAAIGLRGFNLTIPHKQNIMPLLSDISDVAQAVGAVNTVWRTENGWSGTNTDVAGFLAPLRNRQQDWSQSVATILGYGGAARAVVAGCDQLGCAEICVLGRSPDKRRAFQQSWAQSSLASKLRLHPWSALPDLLPKTNLLVNATPVGMHPKVEASPLSAAAQEQLMAMPANAIAYDLIYTPSPTQFLQQAQDRGAIPLRGGYANAIDGLEMLVQQGAAALEIWLQQSPPVDVMRQSLKQALGL